MCMDYNNDKYTKYGNMLKCYLLLLTFVFKAGMGFLRYFGASYNDMLERHSLLLKSIITKIYNFRTNIVILCCRSTRPTSQTSDLSGFAFDVKLQK